MQNTPNFNLPYPEGTDIYNPLTFEPVAMPIIDEAMQDNKVHTVQVAEHNKQGNNHALTREVVDADVFYFIAADDFVDGDTFTVDGNTVTARLTNGQNLQNDAFKINSAVICILKNNILTVITFNKPIVDAQLSAESSNPVQNKVITVPLTNQGNAINTINTKIGSGNIPQELGNDIITALTSLLGFQDVSTAIVRSSIENVEGEISLIKIGKLVIANGYFGLKNVTAWTWYRAFNNLPYPVSRGTSIRARGYTGDSPLISVESSGNDIGIYTESISGTPNTGSMRFQVLYITE